jgi:hypothetical protein
MKLEEALKHLREGKKIRHTFDHKEDECLMGCWVSLFYGKSPKSLSVVKMTKKDNKWDVSPDMEPKKTGESFEMFDFSFGIINIPIFDYKNFINPSIDIRSLIDDNWEVLNES